MVIQALGRVMIRFSIRAETGLHIGGRAGGIEIGGLDNPVIRDPLTNRPLIPGSSLKGKMRCLLEKHYGLNINRRIGQSYIHSCEEKDEQAYKTCRVCRVFGIPGEEKIATPTRLLVRDVLLSDASANDLEAFSLDRPYTEVKTEVAIDRITSAANPRPLERVPAGAVFGPGEMVYTVYSASNGLCNPEQDVEFLAVVFEGMQLVEHDYLGGSGSRGSGKVAFEQIRLELRAKGDYFQQVHFIGEYGSLGDLWAHKDEIIQTVKQKLGV